MKILSLSSTDMPSLAVYNNFPQNLYGTLPKQKKKDRSTGHDVSFIQNLGSPFQCQPSFARQFDSRFSSQKSLSWNCHSSYLSLHFIIQNALSFRSYRLSLPPHITIVSQPCFFFILFLSILSPKINVSFHPTLPFLLLDL